MCQMEGQVAEDDGEEVEALRIEVERLRGVEASLNAAMRERDSLKHRVVRPTLADL